MLARSNHFQVKPPLGPQASHGLILIRLVLIAVDGRGQPDRSRLHCKSPDDFTIIKLRQVLVRPAFDVAL